MSISKGKWKIFHKFRCNNRIVKDTIDTSAPFFGKILENNKKIFDKVKPGAKSDYWILEFDDFRTFVIKDEKVQEQLEKQFDGKF